MNVIYTQQNMTNLVCREIPNYIFVPHVQKVEKHRSRAAVPDLLIHGLVKRQRDFQIYFMSDTVHTKEESTNIRNYYKQVYTRLLEIKKLLSLMLLY
jgi:hypothetical protein